MALFACALSVKVARSSTSLVRAGLFVELGAAPLLLLRLLLLLLLLLYSLRLPLLELLGGEDEVVVLVRLGTPFDGEVFALLLRCAERMLLYMTGTSSSPSSSSSLLLLPLVASCLLLFSVLLSLPLVESSGGG